jgi:hypothetical protein
MPIFMIYTIAATKTTSIIVTIAIIIPLTQTKIITEK